MYCHIVHNKCAFVGLLCKLNVVLIFNACVQGGGILLELCQNAEQGYGGGPYQPVEMPPGFGCAMFRRRTGMKTNIIGAEVLPVPRTPALLHPYPTVWCYI